MLPHVDTKDGHTLGDGVLVLGGNDAEAGDIVLDQPAPAAAGDTKQSGVKDRFELIKTTPDTSNLGDQLRCRIGRSIRA